MLKPVMRIGYRIFGKHVHKYRANLQPLADRLKLARLPYTVEEYVSGTILLTLIAFLVSFIASLSMFAMVYGYSPATSVVVAFILSVSISGLVWAGLMGYPGYVANNRKDEIDSRLAYAVTHMATLAGTGIPPIVLFKALTRFKDYGEISKECAYIVRDVEVFGKDMYSAIADAARYSPSKLWSEVLWGIVSTLRSGGNLRQYLADRARQLVEMHERQEKKAMETLNVLTEIFMVVFVLAPVIGVIMIVFMSMIGGTLFGVDLKILLIFIVYFILPVVGVGFLMLGSMSKPKEVI